MKADHVGTLIARVRAVETDIGSIRRAVNDEPLSVSDRQYLGRCFDLLDMELAALCEYIAALREEKVS